MLHDPVPAATSCCTWRSFYLHLLPLSLLPLLQPLACRGAGAAALAQPALILRIPPVLLQT